MGGHPLRQLCRGHRTQTTARVEAIQERTFELRSLAMEVLVALIEDVKTAPAALLTRTSRIKPLILVAGVGIFPVAVSGWAHQKSWTARQGGSNARTFAARLFWIELTHLPSGSCTCSDAFVIQSFGC